MENQMGFHEILLRVAELRSLPSDYGYVVLILVVYCYVNFWMSLEVEIARKKYKVPYPALYALESENRNAFLFNCIQRGHQNSLEMMPIFFLLMALGGIEFPKLSAASGVMYVIFRIAYFNGYATGVPDNRTAAGEYSFYVILGLTLLAISVGFSLLIS